MPDSIPDYLETVDRLLDQLQVAIADTRAAIAQVDQEVANQEEHGDGSTD